MIAQQWQFTYRYPQYGGVETFSLALPVGRTVEFHVTSLDVIHSFWAYQLGVKADAVPGADNIAIHDAEERGALRGALRRALRPVARLHVRPRPRACRPPGSAHWIHEALLHNAPSTHYLPKFAHVYYPDPTARGG